MKTLLRLLPILLGLTLVPPAFAQVVPSLMNYQGRLTDEAGLPLPDGPYSLRFRLFDRPAPGASGETLIWGAAYQANLADGIFNVILGASGGTPVPDAEVTELRAAFEQPERFLELSVEEQSNWRVILPRQQLLSAPFAMQSAHSEIAQTARIAEALTPEVVVTPNIPANSISPDKLAPRPTGGTVSAGGVAASPGTGLSEISYSIAGDFEPVHNLSVTLATRGRPVKFFLTAESGSASSYFYLTRAQEGGNAPRAEVQLVRGGSVVVGNYTISISNPGVFLIIPSSSVSFYDGAPPVEGNSTYSIQVRLDQPGVLRVRNMRLVAHEL